MKNSSSEIVPLPSRSQLSKRMVTSSSVRGVVVGTTSLRNSSIVRLPELSTSAAKNCSAASRISFTAWGTTGTSLSPATSSSQCIGDAFRSDCDGVWLRRFDRALFEARPTATRPALARSWSTAS